MFVIGGCTTIKVEKKIKKKADLPSLHEEVIIDPSRSYEECLELFPIHVMEYSFKASKPVKFNIHYHGEKDIFYPVSKDGVSEWSGVLDVGKQQYYSEEQEYFCLMWDNPHAEPVSLTFECKVKDK